MSAGRELYIYYRVRAENEAPALQAIRSLQQRVRHQFPMVVVRLLRRVEPGSGVQTWMETYAIDGAPKHRAGGVDEPLQRRIEAEAQSALALLDGPRHVEWFVPEAEESP